MMKLVRNTMSEWKVLKDKNGNSIEWKCIEELHELQESEGLRLANKLRAAYRLETAENEGKPGSADTEL